MAEELTMTVEEAKAVVLDFGRYRWYPLGRVMDENWRYFMGLVRDRKKFVSSRLRMAVEQLVEDPVIAVKIRQYRARQRVRAINQKRIEDYLYG